MLLDFFGSFGYAFESMGRNETLDDLIDAAGLPLMELAKRAKVDPKSILALRQGTVERARVSTVSKLAKALGTDTARVRAAIDASRAAARWDSK